MAVRLKEVTVNNMNTQFNTLKAHEIRFVASLQVKKNRQLEGLFLVEGDKTVRELLSSDVSIHSLYATKSWLQDHKNLLSQTIPIYSVTESQLKIISSHEQPNGVLAVAHVPAMQDSLVVADDLYLAGDNLNDPGNLGSIIRIADWFGIKKVILSKDSVDAYNPKTVSAAKGSLFRTEIIYTDLADFFEANTELEVFGAFMDGENIYNSSLPQKGIIVIGNEANGIRRNLESYITKRISIPSFGNAESLNAAIATGIIVSEFKRRSL